MRRKIKQTKRSSRLTKRKRITKRRKPLEIFIRRSSGRKERFDSSRTAQTTSRSGVPFMMAKDIAKRVSKKIKIEGKGKRTKTVSAGRLRKMITDEPRDRNQQAIASAYRASKPDNLLEESLTELRKPPTGSADTDQHAAYRADRDSVLHDRSKRLSSSS